MEVGVIIPAYNAARFLPELLPAIRRHCPGGHLLVVNDGSDDQTGDVARTLTEFVINHPVNQGKGAALATGYEWALAQRLDWVYTMDADGQHLPAEMARFLESASDHGWDVVVGTRMADTDDMPWLRKATNRFTSSVISRLAGTRIPDSQSGYRLYRTACLAAVRITTSHYDAESEILVRLARKGYRIGSVPITTVYGDEQSAIHPVRDTVRFFRLVQRLRRDDE
ncbi:MAG: glycosyltransferase family 2 protein [bacterium]